MPTAEYLSPPRRSVRECINRSGKSGTRPPAATLKALLALEWRRSMKRTSVGYRTGFRVLTGDDHSQAATMVIGPGQYEGSPDNSHRSADQWLYVESGAGEAIINGH